MRGVQDVLIAERGRSPRVDGLKGFPEAIEAVFPHAVVQTCIVHLIRYSLLHAAWKERKELAAAIRPIYQAPTAAAAEAALGAFEAYVVEREVSGHRQKLAGGVGPRGAVLRLGGTPSILGGDPAGHLHHQRDREPELDGAPRGAYRTATSPATGPPPSWCSWRCATAPRLGVPRRLGVPPRRNPPQFWRAARAELAIRFSGRFQLVEQ